MNIRKQKQYLPKVIVLLGLVVSSTFSQSALSDADKKSQRIVDSHGHEIDPSSQQPIWKPSAPITLDYELPETIVAGQETSLSVVIDSMLDTPGILLLQYKADDGLNLISSGTKSLEYVGDKRSTDIVFSAQTNGLYYLNLGVMQLDENNNRRNARSFVIPIKIGDAEYVGKMSNVQTKANRPASAASTKSSENIIEMIAN